MNRNLKAITTLVPPPKVSRGLDRSWKSVEKDIGLILPDDYKAFIDLYGTGRISGAGGWTDIWNYRDATLLKAPLRETLGGEKSIAASYRRLEDESNYPCPYPTYPTAGGLLPFASVLDIQNLNWLTKGMPTRWEVVYWHFDGLEFTPLKGDSFSRCLLKMLRQEYTGLERPTSLEPPYQFTDIVM